ncbi:Coiled-coil domain-containing protein 25 [Erysiphe necator]|uniref:Putative coiled-coil domain-containing protein 25 n=1 Tax=Uncinula necator TaxID=52586 RepID=A0A0B1NY01_UNCNE|nr:Coiled-coil domain-containing protein 25 [Erysiphe necator]KHJ30818.1 putative coiled-coil domain-containing protein 25 [Erysiphe necator]
MVYYFTSNLVEPQAQLYMGKDKEENEVLIKYGLEKDVWFHVDKLSSAHVYVRLQEGQKWDSLPEELVNDCAQLTKANSIEGNKKDNITVIYTPWANLKKDGSMVAGQVGFKDSRQVKKILIAQRENAIINRLNKTKVEKFPDLQLEKENFMKAVRKKEQAAQMERKKEQARIAQKHKDMKWQKEHAYDELFKDMENQGINNQNNEDWEDDFM